MWSVPVFFGGICQSMLPSQLGVCSFINGQWCVVSDAYTMFWWLANVRSLDKSHFYDAFHNGKFFLSTGFHS